MRPQAQPLHLGLEGGRLALAASRKHRVLDVSL